MTVLHYADGKLGPDSQSIPTVAQLLSDAYLLELVCMTMHRKLAQVIVYLVACTLNKLP